MFALIPPGWTDQLRSLSVRCAEDLHVGSIAKDRASDVAHANLCKRPVTSTIARIEDVRDSVNR
jgi:hypothetical protein